MLLEDKTVYAYWNAKELARISGAYTRALPPEQRKQVRQNELEFLKAIIGPEKQDK